MRQKGGVLGPPPVILLPESIAAQAAYQLRYKTGAAADEYNLNVVDCNASVTVARPAVFHLSGVLPAAGGKRER